MRFGDIGAIAGRTVDGKNEERSDVFLYVDCTRALSIEILGCRFRFGNGDFFGGPGVCSGSVAKRDPWQRRPVRTKEGKKHCTEEGRQW